MGVHRVFVVPKALRLPVTGIDLDEGLVKPCQARKNHPVSVPFQGGEYVRKPVFSGAFGVSVVPGRRFDGMELEEVEQELHPFRQRDLPGADQPFLGHFLGKAKARPKWVLMFLYCFAVCFLPLIQGLRIIPSRSGSSVMCKRRLLKKK